MKTGRRAPGCGEIAVDSWRLDPIAYGARLPRARADVNVSRVGEEPLCRIAFDDRRVVVIGRQRVRR